MKKLIVAALIALPLAFSARAQWIVYDPTMNIEQILDEAESIAKYVTMIDNQVQQINTLTSQLSEFKNVSGWAATSSFSRQVVKSWRHVFFKKQIRSSPLDR